MTDLTRLLKLLNEGDPIRAEDGLSLADAERMRRRIVAAALEPTRVRAPWQRSLAIAATAVILLIVGSSGSDRAVRPAVAPPEPVTISGSSGEGGRRQLQFATPGGTRIIWIFDENLRLQESMP